MRDVPRSLILGALLHDIGKVVLPAGGAQKGANHSKAGADWLDSHLPDNLEGRDAVVGIAQWHHAAEFSDVLKSPYTLLAYHADNVAAETDREEREGTYRRPTTPLRSIFSRVRLSDGGTRTGEPRPAFYGLETLASTPNGPLPQPDGLCSVSHYERLLKELEEDFGTWCEFGCPVNSLLMMLEKHLSRVPSDTKLSLIHI